MRPGRPQSDPEACRYVDALIAVLAALAICFTAWGGAGAIARQFLDAVDDRHGDPERRRPDVLRPAVA